MLPVYFCKYLQGVANYNCNYDCIHYPLCTIVKSWICPINAYLSNSPILLPKLQWKSITGHFEKNQLLRIRKALEKKISLRIHYLFYFRVIKEKIKNEHNEKNVCYPFFNCCLCLLGSLLLPQDLPRLPRLHLRKRDDGITTEYIIPNKDYWYPLLLRHQSMERTIIRFHVPRYNINTSPMESRRKKKKTKQWKKNYLFWWPH